MNKTTCFWWGFVGAVLPEVLRFFKIISAGQTLPNLNWLLYAGILVVYCICAGLLAIAWKAEAEWKAVWVGASLPALVATLIQSAPSVGK